MNLLVLFFQIRLLEHFEDFGRVLEEQMRVLQYGGHFFGYIVPGGMDHIQKKFGWVNEVIRAITPAFEIQESLTKAEVYRSDEKSPTCRKTGADWCKKY